MPECNIKHICEKMYTGHTYYRESKNLKGNNGQTFCAMSINL